MTELKIQDELLDFIAESFMVEKEEIDLENSLVDEGIIDSFGLIEITAFIEEQYQLSVKEEDMTRDNFGSVNKITAFIEKLLNQN